MENITRSIIAALVTLNLSAISAADVIYVDLNATGAGNGTTWHNAFTDLTNALATAAANNTPDLICMAEGAYRPGTNSWDTYDVPSFTWIVGGYTPGDDWRTPTGYRFGTIITGEIGLSQLSDNINSLFQVLNRDKVTFCRLRMTRAFRTQVPSPLPGAGGCITAIDSDLMLGDVLFEDNYADGANVTSAVFIDNSNTARANRVLLKNANFINNSTSGTFGALFIYQVHPTPVHSSRVDLAIDGCTFYNNRITALTTLNCTEYAPAGAYIMIQGFAAQITNSLFIRNSAPRGLIDTTAAICQSWFLPRGTVGSALTTSNLGGGNWFTIAHNTFYGNEADNCPDIFMLGPESTEISSNIFANQVLSPNPVSLSIDRSFPAFTNNIVSYNALPGGWPGGIGNILDDPLMINPAGHNYSLQSGSPCVDAGGGFVGIDILDLDGDRVFLEDLSFDFARQPRVADGNNDGTYTRDMGAYEKE